MIADVRADITLLLEGTYPYVKGGVSSWVHQLIGALPHWRFALVFLGSRPQDYGPPQYQFPDNVVYFHADFLFSEAKVQQHRHRRLPDDALQRYTELHRCLNAGNSDVLDFAEFLQPQSPFNEAAFNYSEPAWNYITRSYDKKASDLPFIDYFWTVRNLHQPVWVLARIVQRLPRTRLFFSPSTGYAGLLGAQGARSQSRPFVLMEHGIYTKERRIDLMNADWISDHGSALTSDPSRISYLREIWIRFFEILGCQAYAQASPIISLFEAARKQQVRDGADPTRTRIIPNGVDVSRLAALRRHAGMAPPQTIGLLGRVVPIKDIKTFIRAAHELRQRVPGVQAWIIGPEDEDPEYSRECRALAKTLGLGTQLRFLGFKRIEEVLPQIGVMVLSSISEGLPLSVLEGFAAGLPAVTTRVGACSELILGRDEEDRRLGPAGSLINLADHETLAQACAELLENPDWYVRAARAAMQRVERYYDQEKMIATFDALFHEQIAKAGLD